MCIYKPPDLDSTLFMNALSIYLESLKINKKHFIIAGDCNINLIHESSQPCSLFLDLMMSQGFIPTITLPTRITHNSATLIDNIFTNQTNLEHYSKILIDDISDHFPTLYSFSLGVRPKLNLTSRPSLKRIFSIQNYEVCLSLAAAINWDPISPHNPDFIELTPSQSYKLFHSKILFLFNTAFPLIQNEPAPKNRPKTLPWISTEIIIASRKKNRLLKNFTKNQTPENKQILTKFRNLLKTKIRKAEKQFYFQKFVNCDHNMKATWNVINEILGNESNLHKPIPSALCIDNIHYHNPTDIATQFNDYFANIGGKLACMIPPSPTSYCDYLPEPNPNSFQLTPTTPQEILNLLLELDKSASQGPDNLPASFIRSIATYIANPLSIIINHSFSHAVFPDDLKIAKITPIHKSGPKSDPSNFRPISLLNIFSKIYEKSINSRLQEFLQKHSSLYLNQFGFRKHHSTELALIKLLDTITLALNAKQFVTSIFIDLKKAFDTVNFDILLLKLENYGFRGHINTYLKSYLSNRSQFVQIQSSLSPLLPIHCGVPQGSVLGPILFLLYINDLPNACSHNIPIIFADDTTLTFTSNSLLTLKSHINEDLNSLFNWLTANKLTLNISKTNYILFSHPLTPIPPLSLLINQQQIQKVHETTILGVIIDQHLTFKAHIAKVKAKLVSSLFVFTKVRHLIPLQIAWSLYHSTFKAHLTYCLLIWGNSHSSYLQPLNVLHKKFLRTLLLLPNRTPSLSLYRQASSLQIQGLFKYFAAILIYKLFNLPHTLPPTIRNIFHISSQIHNHSTRATHTQALYLLPNSTTLRHNQISIAGPLLWHTIPPHIKSLTSINLFKKQTHLFLLSLDT